MDKSKKKIWYSSKELWFAVVVIANSVLNFFGYPSVPTTPEVTGAVGVIFLALRGWLTESKIVWTNR